MYILNVAESMMPQRRLADVSMWRTVIAGCLVLSSFLIAGCDGPTHPPYLNKFLIQPSPRGTYEATFYNYSKRGGSGFLGATLTSTMHVNVRRRNDSFDPDKGQVFAMRHGYRLQLVWEDEKHLSIEYDSSADMDKQVDKMGTVSIVFKPVAQAALPETYSALPQSKPTQ